MSGMQANLPLSVVIREGCGSASFERGAQI